MEDTIGHLIGLIAVLSIFFVPITGLMIILTTRYAFKPLVETLAKALRESGYACSPERLSLDQDLAEQVVLLRDEVRHVKDAQEVDKRLLGSPFPSGGA